MSGGHGVLEGHCNGGPSGPGEPSQRPGGSISKGRGAKARIFCETKVGGLRTPGPFLQLLPTAGVRNLGSAVQEAARGEIRSGEKPEGRMPPKLWRGTVSPLPRLAPLAHWGWRQRPPTPWAAVGALAVGLLACLVMLFSIQGRLETLREELAALRRDIFCEAPGTAGEQGTPNSQQRADGGPVPPALRVRWERDVGKTPQEPLLRLHKKHSVLHLVPARLSNNEEDGATEIWWATFLRQGRALEPSGQDILVKHTGLYFVYSQVLFHDPTFTMGQVLRRVAPGKPDQILFRCIQSMPQKLEKAYNSCYSGGVFQLQQGDRLSLQIPRFNASFDVSTHGTFLGVLRL